MEFIDHRIVDEVIEYMPNEFNTHSFIQELMRQRPREYTRELYRFESRVDPFFVLHPQIARIIARNERVCKQGKVYTRNIRGRITRNESWRRLN